MTTRTFMDAEANLPALFDEVFENGEIVIISRGSGEKVALNCVSPGWIAVEDWKKDLVATEPKLCPVDHAQHPVGRVGRPEDVAELVLYLVSEKAGFITGQNFVVDGGMTRKMIYLA